jgi:hypothetical protein
MTDNTTPPPFLPEVVSVTHDTPVKYKELRVVKISKFRKDIKSPKSSATVSAPAQAIDTQLTPSPPEASLNAPDTSVQSKKSRIIKTPKPRKAPRAPKTPATAPGQVFEVLGTPPTPTTALARALNTITIRPRGNGDTYSD